VQKKIYNVLLSTYSSAKCAFDLTVTVDGTTYRLMDNSTGSYSSGGKTYILRTKYSYFVSTTNNNIVDNYLTPTNIPCQWMVVSSDTDYLSNPAYEPIEFTCNNTITFNCTIASNSATTTVGGHPVYIGLVYEDL